MNYSELETFLEKKIPYAKIDIIGSSVLRRSIYSVTFDMGHSETVIIQGSIHAREHITTDLIVLQIKEVSENYKKYRAMNMPNIVFVPLVNPDGVELVENGLKSVEGGRKKKFLKSINNGSSDFSLFKANANGVDLNNNFDAKWGSGKYNGLVPAPHGYMGSQPMSEPEVRALAILTIKQRPFFTISYHAKGQEVYYEFFNRPENFRRDKNIAKLVARSLGYKLVNLETESSGGYKDWCVQRLNIPAVTIEVGKDSLSHPIKKDALAQIYKRNRNIIKLLPKILEVYENDRERKVYEKGLERGKEGIRK